MPNLAMEEQQVPMACALINGTPIVLRLFYKNQRDVVRGASGTLSSDNLVLSNARLSDIIDQDRLALRDDPACRPGRS
jgi:hypothetical protein